MKPLYIFDLDGTLALIEHRRHFVERPACPYCHWLKSCDHDKPLAEQRGLIGERPKFKPDWRAFFAACVDDVPNVPVIKTLQALRSAGAGIWIWSGRSDEVRAETEAWLIKHDCMQKFPWPAALRAPELFLMRKAGDHRDDVAVKSEWLAAIEPPEWNRLTAVFDDRQRVVDMWRAAGVPCFQVAPGDF